MTISPQINGITDILAGTIAPAFTADVTASPAARAAALAGLGLARGSAALVFSASATSGVTTIAHNLGAVPAAVIVVAADPGQVLTVHYKSGTLTSTHADLIGYSPAAISATVNVSWLVIA